MVLPISGFLPVPLPMMIPFMGAQSLVIGKMFGEGFQYGKRKISAMPNEEFNKLTFEAMMSNARSEMQASIPTMQAALQDMKPMVETVVHEFTNYLSLVIEAAPAQVQQVVGSLESILLALIGQEKQTGSQTAAQYEDLLEMIRLAFPNLPTASGTDLQTGTNVNIPLTPTGPFQGPEINPKTGEQTPFIEAITNLPIGGPHIPSSGASNVSLQSLVLERKILQEAIRRVANNLQNEQLRTGQNISTKRARVQTALNALNVAKQKLADFLKRHGHRF